MEVIQTLIGVAIGSLIALLIAIWTMRKSSRALRTETAAVLAASETARQEHRDFQDHAKEDLSRLLGVSKNIQHQVRNIEDYTRRLLYTMPEILEKAKDLVQSAETQLWILTYTPCFGRIHEFNKRFLDQLIENKADITDQHGATLHLRNLVYTLVDGIESQAVIPDYRVAFMDPTLMDEHFVSPILTKEAEHLTEDKEEIRNTILTEHELALSTIQQKVARAKKHPTKAYIRKDIYLLKSLPLQIIITKDNTQKETCLVFFIGEQNLEYATDVRGFTTQFTDLVDLFRSIFDSISDHHQSQTVEEWLLGYEEDQSGSMDG